VHDDVEAGTPGVQSSLLDAVVERQAGDVDSVDAVVAQQLLEAGVLKARIALVVGLLPGIDHGVDEIGVEGWIELRARRVADAVLRPWTTLPGERLMVGRMPVARGHHIVGFPGHPVDRLDDSISVGHGQRSPGAEIVLQVDCDQTLHTREYSQLVDTDAGSIGKELRQVLLAADEAVQLDVRGRTDAAVLVPLYVQAGGLHAVFTRRRDDLRRHPGEISFPGGRYDEGESDLVATALREAEEEIGLPPEAVDILGALQPTPTIATGYAVYPFVGMIESGRTWTLSAREVAEVLELSLTDLLAGYGRRRLIRRGLPIRTDTYVVGDHLIWGATARILGDLLDRIGPLLERART
jgi:8-oxo-dGTP pyrophosphatase MutT (NUDIX family)